MQEEIWKDIIGYEGLYEVSSLGRVKSLNYRNTGLESVLKLCINKSGYYHVGLSKDRKVKSLNVHQLVAMSFLGHTPCSYKLVVDHINDNPLDNRVENLQVVTHRFNIKKTQGKYSSQYKGVTWHVPTQKWVSQIRINGKGFHLGYFDCELTASIVYQNKLKTIN